MKNTVLGAMCLPSGDKFAGNPHYCLRYCRNQLPTYGAGITAAVGRSLSQSSSSSSGSSSVAQPSGTEILFTWHAVGTQNYTSGVHTERGRNQLPVWCVKVIVPLCGRLPAVWRAYCDPAVDVGTIGLQSAQTQSE